jgi:hypothetical protein
MDTVFKPSNEVSISESKPNMPAFQVRLTFEHNRFIKNKNYLLIKAMINDIRESTASFAQTSNTSESCIFYYLQI